MAIMASFAGYSDPVDAYINAAQHLAGLMVFTRSEIDSGRLDTFSGSNWWRAVNGGMMLDIQAADELIQRQGDLARSSDPRVQAWIDDSVNTHGGSEGAQHALWRAHQLSLHRGIDCYRPYVARHMQQYGYLVAADLIGLNLGSFWADWD